ncbi:MAG: hypothetical protein FWE98_03490 [Oscillospiraceae bacterium]|nr:hypothetical protein [Oscillospiraceae bacterium]
MHTQIFSRKLRILAILLAAGLALSILGACGGGGGTGQMGRYVEESLNDNVDIAGRSAALQDGILSWIGEQNGSYTRFEQSVGGGDASVPALASGWLEELTAGGGGVNGVSEAPNGTLYALYTDGEGKSRLAKFEDGQAYDIPMENWTAAAIPNRGGSGQQGARIGEGPATPTGPAGGGNPGGPGGPGNFINIDPNALMPQSVTALDGGFLISYMRQGVVQYDAAGKEIRRYGETERGMGMGGLGFSGGLPVFGNTMAWADTQKGEILLFDLSAGKLVETVACEGLDSQAFVGLDAEGLFVADGAGISRRKNNAWELLVDGSLTSLVTPNLTIQDLLCGGEGVWYAFLGTVMGENTRLVRFRYDPDIPTQPSQELTVFSLYDNATARLAIAEFQRKNPDVRVTLEVGIETPANAGMMITMGPGGGPMVQEEPDNSATVDDVKRALNTRLLAGKGPDLILLDGLPLQSYIEKGVLKDISALAQRLTTEEGLLANLTSAYAFNGKTYALPSRFSLPVMLGDGARLEGLESLADLVNAVRDYGKAEPALLRAPDTLWQDTGLIMYGYDASVAGFTNANGSLDEAALARYLGEALALTDALREIYPKANQAQPNMAYSGMVIRRVSIGARDIANRDALIHMQTLDNSMTYIMTADLLGAKEGMEIASLFGQGYFTPVGGIGVVSAGKQQALAESFIQTLVGAAVQENFLADAFPVNRAAWGIMAEQLEERFSMLGSEDFNDMGFPALCESLDTPLFVDQYVKSAVQARAKSIVDGSMTPEEAAAKIVADTRLYLAE